jgi:iron complex transport system substrate-binding protein
MRIISLAPNATEILCALDLAQEIVGISHDCDFPREILHRPRLTRTKLSSGLGSWEIDQVVRASASLGQSLYAIETEQLQRLEPDLIVTQEQCKVCAVDRDHTVCALNSIGLEIKPISVSANSFPELYRDILAVGALTGHAREAQDLVAKLRDRVARVAQETSSLPRPRVFCLSWFAPLMAAGNWITEMVRISGGDPRLGGKGKASSLVDSKQVARERPEIVFLLPCSFSQERTAGEWTRIRNASPWKDSPATRDGRVFTLESSLFHRSGPRLVDGLELMAALIHPGCCSFLAASEFSQRVA